LSQTSPETRAPEANQLHEAARLSAWGRQVRLWLLDPFELLPHTEQVRKIRLLSSLLLIMVAILLFWRSFLPGVEAWIFPVIFLAYLIGRTRFFQVAAVAAALVFSWPSYQTVISIPNIPDPFVTAAFSWQLIPLIFCSLILETSYLVLLVGINFGGMLLLPLLVSNLGYQSMASAYAMIGWVSLALVIVNQVRDRIERDRQKEIIASEARYKRLTEQLATLHEISRVVSTLGDLPQVLEVIFRQVQRIMLLDTFILGLYDKEQEQLTFPFIYDNGKRWIEAPIRLQDDSWLAQLLKNRKPTLINRKQAEVPPILNGLGVPTSSKEALSVMIVPLRKGNLITGSITVQSSLPQAYTQEHLNLLTGVAYQAATAIENSLLYTQLNKELTELNAAQARLQQQSKRSQVLAYISNLFVGEHLELADLLHEIALYISQLFGDLCAIRLMANQENYLETNAVAGQDSQVLADLMRVLQDEPQSFTDGLSAYVMRAGQPLRIARFELTSTKPRFSPAMLTHFQRYPVHSLIAIPLRAQGQVLGVMNLWRYIPDHPYDEEDEVFFMDLGDRIALGIANARLYQALQNELSVRTRAEAEVRTLNAELEQRVRERTAQLQVAVQELESFAYSVSHDLRAPLRAINGYTTAFQEDFGEQLHPEASKYLDHIRQASRRMARLIDDLLSLSRITRSEMVLRQVNLAEITREVIAELRKREPDRQVDLVAPDTLEARADPNLVYVALENMIGNAWKFTSHHPTARIEIGEMQQAGERIFFIRDDGVGFDMKFIERLFMEFQRLHSPDEFEGTGIGLVIVRRIIQRHGGRVWAEAAPEQGATFYFTLGT
jgi:signal transduction histidine kinase